MPGQERCAICEHPLRSEINDALREKANENPEGGWKYGKSFKKIAEEINYLFEEKFGYFPIAPNVKVDYWKLKVHIERQHLQLPVQHKKALVVDEDPVRRLEIEGGQVFYLDADGERKPLPIPSLRDALLVVIGIGIENIKLMPEQVTVKDVIRCVELMHKIDKSSLDRDEFLEAVVRSLKEKDVDPESPLGLALATREVAGRMEETL